MSTWSYPLHWLSVKSCPLDFITEKICVEIGAFLYYFILFQAWIFAILENNIKKLGYFLPEVSKQLQRQSSKYIHSYNNLLLVRYFCLRTICAFVLGGDRWRGPFRKFFDPVQQSLVDTGILNGASRIPQDCAMLKWFKVNISDWKSWFCFFHPIFEHKALYSGHIVEKNYFAQRFPLQTGKQKCKLWIFQYK